jgi:hypothetical protein
MSPQRGQRGQENQALGRSRGGFSTIHLKTDFDGLPIAFHLTGGQASDSRNFETLLDIPTAPAINETISDKIANLSIGFSQTGQMRIRCILTTRQLANGLRRRRIKAFILSTAARRTPGAAQLPSFPQFCSLPPELFAFGQAEKNNPRGNSEYVAETKTGPT